MQQRSFTGSFLGQQQQHSPCATKNLSANRKAIQKCEIKSLVVGKCTLVFALV